MKKTVIHPIVEFDMFLAVLKNLDIVLDPFYFGMGNTFYQSIALGIPIVTMPSDQARGRVVYAGYKQMDIKDSPIANSPDEYIDICKKLAFNSSYKKFISTQLLNSKDKLFNDKYIYKEYLNFFSESLRAAKDNCLLPKNWESSTFHI